jgi:cytidine deaminase
MTFEQLYEQALAITTPRRLSEDAQAGGVGAALLAADGNVYLGVCLEAQCGLGFCAERVAAAAMITAGESRVLKMIAVESNGRIVPPCGCCREFMIQIHAENLQTEVRVAEGAIVTMRELVPHLWPAD